eukprot:9380338-Prorocentrum_lima.AAC.1
MAFSPRMSTPVCRTLYCASAPPGLVANWRCPAPWPRFRARVVAVEKEKCQALRMLMGRRPPLG